MNQHEPALIKVRQKSIHKIKGILSPASNRLKKKSQLVPGSGQKRRLRFNSCRNSEVRFDLNSPARRRFDVRDSKRATDLAKDELLCEVLAYSNREQSDAEREDDVVEARKKKKDKKK
eukprot:g1603.t1